MLILEVHFRQDCHKNEFICKLITKSLGEKFRGYIMFIGRPRKAYMRDTVDNSVYYYIRVDCINSIHKNVVDTFHAILDNLKQIYPLYLID